jgi:hypothetical protein
VTRPSGRLAAPFPRPSGVIEAALDTIRLVTAKPPKTVDELRRVAQLPRPWDLPGCPPALRLHVWEWLDQVAEWINEEFTWRIDKGVPHCWPQHPHIVHELAVVACLRYNAIYAATPDVFEDWHRYTLPMFLDRIANRCGPGGCPPGKHADQPGTARTHVYRTANERQWRSTLYSADSQVDARQ